MNLTLLRKLEGLQTVETAQQILGYSRQSTINLMSKLRKAGYVTSQGGGKQPRIYKITLRKQLPRKPGMFDLLNKYSPMKLQHWYDHQVHGVYRYEDALIDAIKTESFRAILVSLRLFNHITDWPYLYKKANENNCWQKVGALYDVARLFVRVRKMPKRYRKFSGRSWTTLIKDYTTTERMFKPIAQRWKTEIPFTLGDIGKVKYDYT